MNTYITQFVSKCPVNGIRVTYTWRITADVVIPVEDMLAAVEEVEQGTPVFHEDIADRLAAKFPGQHTITAFHHGVTIETVRP